MIDGKIFSLKKIERLGILLMREKLNRFQMKLTRDIVIKVFK